MALADLIEQATAVTDAVTQLLVTPLLIFFVGVAAGKLAQNLLRTMLGAVELDTHAQRVTGQPVPATELTAGVVAGLIYAVSTALALRSVGLLLEAVQLVGLVLGVFALLALALGARDFLPNFFSGISKRRSLKVGDAVRVDGLSGEVTRLGWLSVRLVTADGEVVAVPYRGL